MNFHTLAIIKPDAVAKNKIGAIISRFEDAGMKIVAAEMKILREHEARGFYAVHKDRPFFDGLVKFMCSDMVLVLVLCGEDAVARTRKLMGATDPAQATPGTIRADFGNNVEENAVHGSDSDENAAKEIKFFFPYMV